jgi:hypothetical protein
MRNKTIAACILTTTSLVSQSPLPPNYKAIFDNPYVLVQQVHYGPHEFVPAHDHPAVTTVYVYLNNSGVVDIAHEGPGAETVHRPPTHTGAFRISPGAFERHSVQNQSDLPSDFLRIELKRLPANSISAEFRGAAPQGPFHSTSEVLYDNPGLRIERFICVADEKITFGTQSAPSVWLILPLRPAGEHKQPLVVGLPANKDFSDKDMKAYNKFVDGLDGPWEVLQLVLPQH